MGVQERLGRCQCLSACKNHSQPKSAFCENHKDKCPQISPLSGCEPDYNSKLWNGRREHVDTHNCFMYALNILDPKQIYKCLTSKDCNLPFHQPGLVAGFLGFDSERPKTCPEMIARILGDNPSIKQSQFEERCPNGTSKIALVVDEDQDYHFLRQDSDGWWSQKGGAKPVTKLDAGGHPIWNPELADNNWTNEHGVLNYDIFCGHLCVPRNVTQHKIGDIANEELKLRVTTGGSRVHKHTRKHRKTKKRHAAPRAQRSKKSRVPQTTRYRGRRA